MARLNVILTLDEKDAILLLAERERRDPRAQARMRRALVALALAAAAVPALAEDGEFCARLADVVAAAPEKFRGFATAEVWTSAESYRARIALPHFDSCWVDQVGGAFFCLAQPAEPGAATPLAATIGDEVATCFANVASQTEELEAEPGVRRLIARWAIGGGRRVHLVERRPQRATAPGAVFLYVY
jgi:hypothetical protein